MNGARPRQEAAERLRRAMSLEAFGEVPAALAEYRRRFEESLAAWPSDGPRPMELARESVDLMQWALRVARSARARTSRALDQVSAAQRYHRPDPPTATWKTEG